MSLRDAAVIDRRYNCTALNGTRPLARATAEAAAEFSQGQDGV
jgi:hypothetical protein